MQGFTHEATTIPAEVEEHLPEIVEASIQAAFKMIADQFEALGFPVTGDFAPDEVAAMEETFETFVRTMALNNNTIAELNGF